MRKNLNPKGAERLVYEIREMVKVATEFESLGLSISWENKNFPLPKYIMLATLGQI